MIGRKTRQDTRYESYRLRYANYNWQHGQIVTHRVPFQLFALSTLLQRHAKMAMIESQIIYNIHNL